MLFVSEETAQVLQPAMRRAGTVRKSLVLAILCLCLGLAGPLVALGQEQTPSERRLGSLEKSLILPGWGQLTEKRYIEGALFIAAEAFCLYGILVNDHTGNRNYELYKKAETMDEAVRFRLLTEKFDARRNRFLLAAAAVWAVNLVDIALIVKNKEKRDKAFSLRIERGQNTDIAITARCRF